MHIGERERLSYLLSAKKICEQVCVGKRKMMKKNDNFTE